METDAPEIVVKRVAGKDLALALVVFVGLFLAGSFNAKATIYTLAAAFSLALFFLTYRVYCITPPFTELEKVVAFAHLFAATCHGMTFFLIFLEPNFFTKPTFNVFDGIAFGLIALAATGSILGAPICLLASIHESRPCLRLYGVLGTLPIIAELMYMHLRWNSK